MSEDKREVIKKVLEAEGVKIDNDDDIVEDMVNEEQVCELNTDGETDEGTQQNQTSGGGRPRPQKIFVARVKRRVRRPDGTEDEDYDIYTFNSEGKPTRRLMAK